MVRVSTIFIAICMVIIAASFGAVAYFAIGFGRVEAAVGALALLCGLVLYNTASMRVRDRTDVGDQIADLSRGTADLARQVADYGRRLQVLEAELKARRPQTDIAPLVAEIGELSALVKDLAETVAAQEARASEAAVAPTMLAIAPAVAPDAPPIAETPAAPPPATAAGPKAQPAATGAAAAVQKSPDGPFKGLNRDEVIALLSGAVEAGRLDLHLQPIVTLPQRKVRFYESFARLRAESGDLWMPADFLPYAETGGLVPKIDNIMLFRCVQVIRRLLSKNRDVSLFCNVSALTLADAQFFPQFAEFIDANRAIAPSLILEFTQAAFRNLGPLESESLAALAEHGFRFSLDNVTDLRIEPRELAERGFRFLKVPAGLLLGKTAAAASDIHPADLSGLLGRFGIELIADRIENETTVIDLLDYDVRFGQGFLFSPPRPVRPEALQGVPEREGATPVVPAPSEAATPVAADVSGEPRGPSGSRALPKTRLARGATGTA